VKILDIVTSPWAIVPEKLVEIQEIYMTHLRGEKIDIAAVEARIGKKLENQVKTYEVENGVATVYVEGIIAKRMNFFMQISGGTSTQLLERDIKEALQDPKVDSILLYIDSPGGAVDGTQEISQEIFKARGKGKPIVAFTDGMMASAAYWIGAAADRSYISGNTTQVGSIGVVARHLDVSKYEEKLGFKTSEITAGRYKRIASQYAPLSESGRRSIQDDVDYIYSVMLSDIAAFRTHRSLSLEPVKDGKEETIPWADGRVFLGHQALEVGLVDGVSTIADLKNRMSKEKSSFLARAAWAENAERRLQNGVHD